MSRNPVQVRDATPEDAEALLAIWADFSRRTYSDRFPVDLPETETAGSVARIAADPDERLVVGLVDDRVVGAALLQRAAMSPIHTESAIHISHLHVLGEARRNGVGRALIEAALSWAEEKDTSHILAAASVNSRDANRFMARLGLAQVAVVRGATVAAMRAKLPREAAAVARIGVRPQQNLAQLLAHRRSLRRSQTKSV